MSRLLVQLASAIIGDPALFLRPSKIQRSRFLIIFGWADQRRVRSACSGTRLNPCDERFVHITPRLYESSLLTDSVSIFDLLCAFYGKGSAS